MFVRVGGALLASVSIFAIGAAQAQDAPKPSETTDLDAISISAEREPTKVFDSPATISIRDADEIDRKSIKTPRDLVRDEPGVSVTNQPARTGAGNYVIRGIGENRVRLQIDGLKIPDFPASNVGAGTYTRDFIDFDSLKQIEIIRGPASALYGSDAIGGVVSFVTKDPSDYLDLVGKNWFLSGKLAFDTTDRGFSETVTGAARIGQIETLLLYTHREGHEIRPNGYLRANPQDYTTHNVLGKVVYNAGEAGVFKLTGEFTHKQVDTDIRTDLVFAGPTQIRDSRGNDTTSRPRLSFDWALPLTWAVADSVKTSLYWTEIDRTELTSQLRAVGSPTINRARFSDFNFNQEIAGAEIQFNKSIDLGGWNHKIIYGATLDQTDTKRPRDRYEQSFVTGIVNRTVAGETFPNKNFPDTETTQGAFYIQDTAQWGALRIIPAIRFDYYHLDPNPDADFARSNKSNFTVEKVTQYNLSPKLGLTYDLTENYRLFGQYARGFRAPPYDNANFGFSNPVFGYEILPNGNLDPETSDSFEAGLRGRFGDGSSFQLTGFYNLYHDFIDTRVVGFSPAGLMQFQYQNLSKVRIYGFEAKGYYRVTPEWTLFSSFAYANGEDEQTHRPIDSVDPFTLIGGLRYTHASGWSGELRAKLVARQDRVSLPTVLQTGSYATIDALVSYNMTPNLSLNAAVYNILDKRYFNHADVAGQLAVNPNIELFRAPGRTFAMNATYRW